MNDAINILVASRYDEDRDQILSLLTGQNDFNIAGVEKDETGAIIKSEKLKPDVLIMDLHHLKMTGPELAPIIHRRSPSTSIVILSDRDEENYAYLAFKAGISGFLLKKTDTNLLAHVVNIVFLGGRYISTSIKIRIINTIESIGKFPGLSERKPNLLYSQKERCIIMDIAQGFSDDEIAKHLNYSAGTVRNCLTSIKRKTKLKNRIQIVLFSLVYGLINPQQLDIFKTNRQFAHDTIQ